MTQTNDYFDSAHAVGEDARLRAISLRRRFFITLPLGAIIMLLSMIPALQFTGWQWVVAVLALPVVTWGAWPFHKAAFKAARHGSTTMDTLVSLGVIASSLWSYWALFFGGAGDLGMKMSMSLIPRMNHGHAELYFEAATMIVVFLLGGRWAESASRYRAGDALRALLTLGAKEATLVTPEGDQVIPASDLQEGDLFRVAPGEKIATDGVITQGESALDTSLLTGESLPVDVAVGDAVTGATLNTWGTLIVEATRVGADTTLAQIGRLVEQAQATKAPVQRLADRVSAIFVPVVIGISLVTLAVWLILGWDAQAAFTAAVAVLVVACPCALGLATPTALLVGSGRASQLGIIIQSAEVMEHSQQVNTAALDKTGTITTGVLSVEEVMGDTQTLEVAAAVERHSEHPLAKAVFAAAPDAPEASAFSNHAGKGVSGLLAGDLILVGGSRWLSRHGVSLPADLQARQDQAEASGATVVAVVKVPDYLDEAMSVPSSIVEAAPGSVQVQMKVGGMTCASCVNRVERKLKKLPGVDAQVNLATESATITLTSDHDDAELEKTVEAAGYEPHVVGRTVVAERATVTSAGGRALPEAFDDAEVLGVIVLRDTIKPTSKEAIAQLRTMGVEPVLLSGDNSAAAHHIADQVGITTVIAEVLPDEKQQVIKDLQSEDKRVAMVGDGVNDAAALAQAQVGIAMGSGTDAAIAVADITLVNSELTGVPRALGLARRIFGVIKGNLFWAFFYNVAAIPLAFLGLLNPMIAAAAMAMSSVFVVMNSLRLRNA
ncbi:HAD-IC family P-type ATPase [Actinomycetaceae bacterium WB03_NA08]|uniref:P-type Cu(+) transporter n=1 Tax=Scrofimicrobium canadense TaxID=2652290 RepID=A0A6N7W4Z8_9ACTO|nr:HAD-IC family P-type ATPase [Scrofimicrobium canadense]MSS83198.1 HAD-IC family P-type ATPase [Scrofimicrobium canadense]